jgi:diguanylate cyclase
VLNREQLFATIERLALPLAREGALLLLRTQGLREYEAMLGYAAAEALARTFEARLRECLRDTDVAIGIGECDYAVMLPALRDPNHALLAASKVARSFQEPLLVRNRPAWLDVAVGACMVSDAPTPDALCRSADAACKLAMQRQERYALHTGSPAPAIQYEDLHEAIAGNRLQVHLQPIFSLRTGALSGFESLSRWSDSAHGRVGPDVFVPMAERTGLIHELSRWNLNATLRHCAPWLQRRPELKCSVNLSPVSLISPGFVESMASAARIWKVPPSKLMLEVTETAFVENQQRLAQALSALHEMGFGIAIDDFGTGYSSLSYLKYFPVDELKIDMSFVRDLLADARSTRLVASMIEMAHGMQAEVVAEGIESPDIWARLQEMGCDYGQGYYPGRPQPAEDALAMLASAS